MPLLSVITINYNNAGGLEKTMFSVLEQSFQDFEYIVIDGGSTDGSVELATKFRTRLSVFVSEKDSGIYNAQNKGIAASKGDYLLFLNSGDFICNHLVFQKVFSTPPVADIIYGNMLINWGNNSISQGKMPDVITLEHMYKDTLWHPVSFIKRGLFEKLGYYNETYRLVADYEFFFRAIIMNKASTQHIDLDIAEYNTLGASSKPANKRIEQEERRRVIQSYLSAAEISALEKSGKTRQNLLTRFFDIFKN